MALVFLAGGIGITNAVISAFNEAYPASGYSEKYLGHTGDNISCLLDDPTKTSQVVANFELRLPVGENDAHSTYLEKALLYNLSGELSVTIPPLTDPTKLGQLISLPNGRIWNINTVNSLGTINSGNQNIVDFQLSPGNGGKDTLVVTASIVIGVKHDRTAWETLTNNTDSVELTLSFNVAPDGGLGDQINGSVVIPTNIRPSFAPDPPKDFTLAANREFCQTGDVPVLGVLYLTNKGMADLHYWTVTGDSSIIDDPDFIGDNFTHNINGVKCYEGTKLPAFSVTNLSTTESKKLVFTVSSYLADDCTNHGAYHTHSVTITVNPIPEAYQTCPNYGIGNDGFPLNSLEVCPGDLVLKDINGDIKPLLLPIDSLKGDTLFATYTVTKADGTDGTAGVTLKNAQELNADTSYYKITNLVDVKGGPDFNFELEGLKPGDQLVLTYWTKAYNGDCENITDVCRYIVVILQEIDMEPYVFTFEDLVISNDTLIEVCAGEYELGLDYSTNDPDLAPDRVEVIVPVNNITEYFGTFPYNDSQLPGKDMIEFKSLNPTKYSDPVTVEIISYKVSTKNDGDTCQFLTDTLKVTFIVKPTPTVEMTSLRHFIGCADDNNEYTNRTLDITALTAGTDTLEWTYTVVNFFLPKPVNANFFPSIKIPINLEKEEIVQGIKVVSVPSAVDGLISTTISIPEEMLLSAPFGLTRSYTFTPINECEAGKPLDFFVSTLPNGATDLLLDLTDKILEYKNGDMIQDIWLTPYHYPINKSPFNVYWERVPESDDVARFDPEGKPSRDGVGTNIIPRFYAVNNTDRILNAVYKFYVENQFGCRYYIDGELIIRVTPYIIEDENLFMDEIADITTCEDTLVKDLMFNTRYMFEYPNYTNNTDSLDNIRYTWRLVNGGPNIIQSAIEAATKASEETAKEVYDAAIEAENEAKENLEIAKENLKPYLDAQDLVDYMNLKNMQVNPTLGRQNWSIDFVLDPALKGIAAAWAAKDTFGIRGWMNYLVTWMPMTFTTDTDSPTLSAIQGFDAAKKLTDVLAGLGLNDESDAAGVIADQFDAASKSIKKIDLLFREIRDSSEYYLEQEEILRLDMYAKAFTLDSLIKVAMDSRDALALHAGGVISNLQPITGYFAAMYDDSPAGTLYNALTKLQKLIGDISTAIVGAEELNEQGVLDAQALLNGFISEIAADCDKINLEQAGIISEFAKDAQDSIDAVALRVAAAIANLEGMTIADMTPEAQALHTHLLTVLKNILTDLIDGTLGNISLTTISGDFATAATSGDIDDIEVAKAKLEALKAYIDGELLGGTLAGLITASEAADGDVIFSMSNPYSPTSSLSWFMNLIVRVHLGLLQTFDYFLVESEMEAASRAWVLRYETMESTYFPAQGGTFPTKKEGPGGFDEFIAELDGLLADADHIQTLGLGISWTRSTHATIQGALQQYRDAVVANLKFYESSLAIYDELKGLEEDFKPSLDNLVAKLNTFTSENAQVEISKASYCNIEADTKTVVDALNSAINSYPDAKAAWLAAVAAYEALLERAEAFYEYVLANAKKAEYINWAIAPTAEINKAKEDYKDVEEALEKATAAKERARLAYEGFYRNELNYDSNGVLIGGVITCPIGYENIAFALAGIPFDTIGSSLFAVRPLFRNSEGPEMFFSVTTVEKAEITYLTLKADGSCNYTNVGDVTVPEIAGADWYRWTVTGDAIDLIAGEAAYLPSFASIKVGTATITIVPVNALGCDGDETVIKMCVRPAPVLEPIADHTVCADGGTLTINAKEIGASHLQKLNLVYVSGEKLDYTITGGTIVFSGIKNTTRQTLYSLWTLTLVDEITGAVSNAVPVRITIEPVPVVLTIDNITASNGQLIPAVKFTGNHAGGGYSWNLVSGNDQKWLSSTGEGNAFPAFEAINESDNVIILKYEVVANSIGKCGSSEPEILTITIYPDAKIGRDIEDITLCSGAEFEPIVFPAAPSVTATPIYKLEFVSGTVLGLKIEGNKIVAENMPATDKVLRGVYRLTAYNRITNVEGETTTFTVSVYPNAKMDQPSDITVYHGDLVQSFAFTGNHEIGSYSWTKIHSTHPEITDYLAENGKGLYFPTFRAENGTNQTIVVTYVVTPIISGANCPGEAKKFEVQIYPTPLTPEIADIIICTDEVLNIAHEFTTSAGVDYTVNYVAGYDFGVALTLNNTYITSGEDKFINPYRIPLSATYSVRASKDGHSGIITYFEVKVIPAAHVNPLTPDTIKLMSGDVLPIITFSGNTTGGTYIWNKIGGHNILNLPTAGEGNFPGASDIELYNETADLLTATYKVKATNDLDCPSDSIEFTVQVYPKPQVTGLTDIVICSGDEAVGNFVAEADIEYTVAYESGSDLLELPVRTVLGTEGKISGTYTNDTKAPITTIFSVIPFNTVINRYGDKVTFSITVLPVANVNPVDPAVVNLMSGDELPIITFSGNVEGGTYSWEKLSGNPMANFPENGEGNFPGASRITVINEPVPYTGEVLTATYRVTAALDPAYDCAEDTEEFVVNVYPKPQIIGTVFDRTVCDDTDDVIELTAQESIEYVIAYESGSTLVAQPTIVGGNIVGHYTNPTTAPIKATFSVTPYNTVLERSGNKVFFSITVQPELNLDNIRVHDQKFANGQLVPEIHFGTTIPGAQIIWHRSGGVNIGSVESGYNFIPAFTAINESRTEDIYAEYSVQIKYGECYSDVVKFNINVNRKLLETTELLVSVTPTVKQTVCWDGKFTDIALKAEHMFNTTLSGVGFTYNLVGGADVLGFGTSGFLETTSAIRDWALSSAPGTVAGTGKYEVTPIWNNYRGIPVTLEFTRLPKPTVNAIDNIVICSGETVNVKLESSNYSATSFSWVIDNPSGVTGLPADGKSTTAFASNGPLVNTGTAPAVVTVTVTGHGNDCVGDVKTFTITVNPTPVVNPVSNLFIQSGAPVSVTFAGIATEYKWTADANATFIGSPTSGTGNISFTSESVNEPIAVTYTVTPYYNNCVGTPITFSVVVANIPTINGIANVEVCADDVTPIIDIKGLQSGSAYDATWTGGATIGLADGNGTTIPSFKAIYTENGNNLQTVTITVTPRVTVNGKAYTGTPVTFNYVIYPKATVTATTFNGAAVGANYETRLCENEDITLAVSTTGYNVAIQWYKDNVAIPGATSATYTISEVKIIDSGIYHALVYTTGPCGEASGAKSANIKLNMQGNTIYQVGNDVLVILTDPAKNGGFTFSDIQWYKDGALVGTGLTYLYENTLSTSAVYHFVAKDQTGSTYVSCPFTPELLQATQITVAPNPASVGETVTVTAPAASKIQVASNTGAVISDTNASGTSTQIKAPNIPGVYIVNVIANDTKKSVTLIVK